MKTNVLTKKLFLIFILGVLVVGCSGTKKKQADKPLFHDPIYDGSTDPTIIWNRAEKKWFMFYTNRRSNVHGLKGIESVHGSRIGIAESIDGGASWKYRDTCDIQYHTSSEYTYWAPEVIYSNGLYHMYLTYVPGIFNDWNHPRWIIHLTSKNLINWNFQSKLKLSSNRCIDACVFHLPNGTWRMYYNNEEDNKSIYYADSPDLFKWTDSGEKVIGDQQGEGPNVFYWKGKSWMAVDNWNGLGMYYSDDFANWTRQGKNILQVPGIGADDQEVGHHADIVVSGDRAFIFYFSSGGSRSSAAPKTRGSAIQVTELKYEDDQIFCNRDEPVFINLKPEN